MLKTLTTLAVLCTFASGYAQQKFTISGYVSDGETGEMLIGANVFDFRTEAGTTSNTYGFYSLTLPAEDSIYLTFTYTGFQPKTYALKLTQDLEMNVALGGSVELETFEVTAETGNALEDRTQMSTVSIPIAEIKKLPAFLGETDILKALQLLPGVQSGGEGQSGLYVRGGSPDQNLILLDGVPVYNASHLFGFFSVFNTDALSNVELIKGGFPARYGGRLSSVLDIKMKEGNTKKLRGAGSIGLIASKLTLEGPIGKSEKTSFLVSGRRTYIDLLARPLIRAANRANGNEGSAGYFFYDGNAKINHRFSDRDRLYLSFYGGRDKFNFDLTENYNDGDRYEQETGFGWGNVTSALRYNRKWSPKLFSNVTLTYSEYDFNTRAFQKDRYTPFDEDEPIEEEFNLSYDSGIRDFAGKIDFDFVPNPNHYIRFGASAIHHRFDPGTFNVQFIDETSNLDTIFGQDLVRANELAVYVEDELKIGQRLTANVGVHASTFLVDGESYTSVQPRLGLRYLTPNRLAIKASFATMQQNVQFLTNENLSLPTDLWLPSTERVNPQTSWQVAGGLAKTFRERYEVSLEGYYKQMKNVISYAEGASFITFGDWQDNVVQGDGEAYGAELLVRKKTGKLTGWIGYSLNWTWRQFDEINFGERFPFKYDRRHDLSIVGIYEFNERVSLSASWVFGSGNAYTLPEARYTGQFTNGFFFDPNPSFSASFFQARNNERTPAYHRMDVGVSFKKQKKRYLRTWSFGAYNAYSRANPFFLYLTDRYNPQTDRTETQLRQVALFPIIPYVNWAFEF